MKTRDFYFELPQELVAQRPAAERGESRLMSVRRATGEIGHHMMADLPALLPPGCVCVFNNSRVRKARLYAVSEDTGGRTEFLLLSTRNRRDWAFLSNKSRRLRPGRVFVFPEDVRAALVCDGGSDGDAGSRFLLRFDRPVTDEYLERCGFMPLPPYIRRQAETIDDERYQTVYAQTTGSAAAPTAGLHFTPRLLSDMDTHGFQRVMVTLHVGLGTFAPVRADTLEDHIMHFEDYSVSEEAARAVNRGTEEGRPLLAVGTTSVRVLESAWEGENGKPAGATSERPASWLKSGSAATNIFIYPGYTFKAVDMLFTNFHTPESTLLMLVSAFAGRQLIFKAYEEAIREKYRFFSYGDAMLIL
jgi:S-adenosylmethionine:tRNA ribosyltransferase-isomerase